ncbi:hypothetical protein BsWGS_24636 [Bradybaena similaris]
MSTNVDQRSKGQTNQVSNISGKDVMKEDDPYMQAPHQMRSWSDQTSDTTYGAPPMSTGSVSESFFQNFYPPNMTYPFMNQTLPGNEGPWSNGTDAMFGMGYDYTNVYGGFGFPFNWDYTNDYTWGTSQVRKDQRGYTTEEGYYPPEMMPSDGYSVMNGGPVPPEQEPIGTVEQGIRGMSIASANLTVDSSNRKKIVDVSQPPIMTDSFSRGDSSGMISPTHHSQSLQSSSSVMCSIGQSHGSSQSQAKKTSWAAIASQPARQQQQFRLRTIPRAPVNPNKPPNLDIGTWDNRGNISKAPLPPSQQPSSQPPQVRHSWVSSSARGSNRQIQPYSTSGPGNEPSLDGGADLNSNNNSSSNIIVTQGTLANTPSYSDYSNNVSANAGARNIADDDSPTTNGDNHQPSAPAYSHPVLDQLKSSNLYNPKEFTLNQKSARYFIIKSYSEDDIHRSIKYDIWCSTEHGNKRLDAAFREREGKGPVYLIYSVNGSGHFCGIAQMLSPVDYNKSAGVWAQDKWKGQFMVKWVYVKDVPNNQLRHIRLENNENKPVTNSRDTQEVPPEKGKQVLRIVHSYKHTTSIFDDFIHYEKRQEQDASTSQQRDNRNDSRGDHRGGDRDHRGGDRDNRGGDRDHRGGDRDQRGGDREYRGGDRDHREFRGGDRDFRGGDRDFRGGDRDQRGGDRDQRGGDRDQRGMDRDQRGGERDQRGGDRDQRGGDRDQRGGDRDQRGGDRDQRGGDRDQRGGDRDFRGGDRDFRGGDRDRGDGPGGRNRDNRRGQDNTGGSSSGRGGRQN